MSASLISASEHAHIIKFTGNPSGDTATHSSKYKPYFIPLLILIIVLALIIIFLLICIIVMMKLEDKVIIKCLVQLRLEF
ncbi:hypothetical protein COOONC_07269 [Cooperia oncophora]